MMSLFLFVHQFKIALCQLSVTTDKERNIAHAQEAIEDAADKGAQLILLPVSFFYFLKMVAELSQCSRLSVLQKGRDNFCYNRLSTFYLFFTNKIHHCDAHGL